jgi:hypothetical protein
MQKILLCFLLFAVAPSAQAASATENDADDTSAFVMSAVADCRKFYFERLDRHGTRCGPTGYAQSYGLKYCERFMSMQFSEAGTGWRDATVQCLVDHLGPISAPSSTASCSEITRTAFKSHAGCYTQPGHSVCDLPTDEIAQIFGALDRRDQLNGRSLLQIGEVTWICGPEIERNLRNFLSDHGL